MKKIILSMSFVALFLSQPAAALADELVVYSSRKEHLIKPVFEAFTKKTGIQVKYHTGKANALIERLKVEGKSTQADMLMTVDAGNLWYAADQGVFQAYDAETINSHIPAYLRDPSNLWTGLSLRARTIVYATQRVKPSELSTYQALANPEWKGRLCLRTSKKVYNKSLVASMIAHDGEQKTAKTIKGWVNNLATSPNAKDSHVMDAIVAGQCDVGVVNTYYYGRLMAKKPKTPLKLFWANQQTTGTHVNVSGAGITKYAKNVKAANKLLAWLTTDKAQAMFAGLNKEFPANLAISPDKEVAAWGEFKPDTLNLRKLGELQADAVKIMQKEGYR